MPIDTRKYNRYYRGLLRVLQTPTGGDLHGTDASDGIWTDGRPDALPVGASALDGAVRGDVVIHLSAPRRLL